MRFGKRILTGMFFALLAAARVPRRKRQRGQRQQPHSMPKPSSLLTSMTRPSWSPTSMPALDTAAIESYITGFMNDAKPPAEDPRQALAASRAAADAFLARFKQLGGRHAVVISSMADLVAAAAAAGTPGKDRARRRRQDDARFSGRHIRPRPRPPCTSPPNSSTPQTVVLRDDVIFVGPPSSLQRLQKIKPQPRWNWLSFPLKRRCGNGQWRCPPTPGGRLRELMPLLPPELGGSSTDFLTRDGMHVRIEVTLPPHPSITLRSAGSRNRA